MQGTFSPLETRAEQDINKFSTLLCDPMAFQQLQHLLFAGVWNSACNSQLLDYLSRIPKWLTLITALPYRQYQFGTVLEQWWIAYQRYPLVLGHRLEQTCTAPHEHKYPAMNGLLGIFLIALRQLLLSRTHQERLSRNNRESEDNYQSYCVYVDGLFACYSRLMVLRLDFSYRSEASFETAQEHFQQLLNNARHNQLFDGLVGRIVKIEYGLEKQIHLHSVWFFNGHKRKGSSDVHLAQRIGEYWCSTITHGAGTYWNCNDNRDDYRHNGIGLIEARDADKRHNLLSYVVKYLCKKDSQEIKPRNQPQAKTLFRGDLRNRNPNLGRQRLSDRELGITGDR